ncbi:hypothetical protein C2G38_2199798 [Gigaspora rosea]|uniref:Uncharacterized protein n=1 Tax=Gigaspora rosea TaxID=44941 RepID=A0A397USJ1_9GLOM|nr:hypothetical protein C2G38_2199798 [Gigaspora rosea]
MDIHQVFYLHYCPKDHQEGTFEFKADNIEVNDTNNIIAFTVDKSSWDYKGFLTDNVKLIEGNQNNDGELDIVKQEMFLVCYSKADDFRKEEFRVRSQMLTDKDGKIDKNGHEFIVNFARAYGDSDKFKNLQLVKNAFGGKDAICVNQCWHMTYYDRYDLYDYYRS